MDNRISGKVWATIEAFGVVAVEGKNNYLEKIDEREKEVSQNKKDLKESNNAFQ